MLKCRRASEKSHEEDLIVRALRSEKALPCRRRGFFVVVILVSLNRLMSSSGSADPTGVPGVADEKAGCSCWEVTFALEHESNKRSHRDKFQYLRSFPMDVHVFRVFVVEPVFAP